MSDERDRLYLDKFNGKLFGVCAGIADYAGINSMWPRLAVIILILTPAAPIAILGYIALALALPRKPVHLYRENYREIFGDDQGPRRPHKRNEDQ
ncbi:PspC domain-containing protein [Altererythrobacter sp. KTW20L]|uniref:PspC domain-containing protein n=1 Tax=Altererythrobacter sp. KTW20L TaxID=2942210 RepID=UPI0020BECD60|nr:PspC domain-containing protein [Altererythrobacter sp. KTW20L]